MKQFVSIIIPTYKRAFVLKYVLESIKRQTYRFFELIVVYKPGGDETEEILEKANGEIIVFMDDDAIPKSNWLEELVKTYSSFSMVGGVSGSAPLGFLSQDGRIFNIHKDTPKSEFPYAPLKGMSGWMMFYGKDGLPHYHPQFESLSSSKKIIPSLLYMGCNMSVKKEAIKDFSISEACKHLILGYGNERVFSYHIWRQGYTLLYNPNAIVRHITHDESLGRYFQSPSRAVLQGAEHVLSFFILRLNEKEVSWIPFILTFFELIFGQVLHVKKSRFLSIAKIYGLIYGFVVGCAFTVSNSFEGNFSIRNALIKFF
ncbi:MAG: glycosyltransferase family 2 protein [Promethearchaeota archaeon]|jgi:glycosyltransferase involved in cell wall biosynthesis